MNIVRKIATKISKKKYFFKKYNEKNIKFIKKNEI